jgi:methionyl-tRNA formyltransferase
MRIVFLAVDDEFAGAMQRHLYERHADWIVGSVISTTSLYKKSGLQAAAFVLRQSGLRYSVEMFRMKVMRKMMPQENKVKVRPSHLAKQHNVPLFYSKNINDGESLDRLKSWDPDLVISTNFSHYVGDQARAVARWGTWNLHKSYLPLFRGMAPSFYALLNGERAAGATLHEIARGFDTGSVVDQVEVPIQPDDSVYSLNQRTSDLGGRMMLRVLERAADERPVPQPQPDGPWPTYTYPSPRQIRDFLRKGLRF